VAISRVQGRKFGPGHSAALAFAALVFFGVVFAYFGVSPSGYLKFLAGLFILVYIPGRSLLWLLRVQARRLEMLSLSLASGLVASTLVNKFSRMFHIEWMFGLWLAAAVGYFFFYIRKHPPRRSQFEFRITWIGIGLTAVLFLVTAMLFIDSYRNGLDQDDGSIIVRLHYYDGFIRIPVIRELSHSVPPQMPFAAGVPLGYHYGMDLFISMFCRYLHLGVFDLNHRLVMTFFWILLALAAFGFGREFFLSEKTALLGIFLVLFGSGGFSYGAAWLFGAPLGGNIFYAFYLFDYLGVNSLMPALIVIFCGFFSLCRYLRQKHAAWLGLTALFFAASAEFKIFFAGPILGVLLIVGLTSFIRFRDKAFLKVWATTAAVAAPLFLAAYLGNKGGLGYVFKLGFINWPGRVLEALRLTALANQWDSFIRLGRFNLIGFLGILLVWIIVILGSFGLSSLALPSMIKKFFVFKKDEQGRFFSSALLAACVLYFFVFNTALGNLPRNILNIYVFYLGLTIVLFFWADDVVRFVASKKTALKIFIVGGVVALSVPNTIYFLRIKAATPDPRRFPHEFMETARWLSRSTPPESVILHPAGLRYVCYFADRRVVLDNSVNSYLPFHLSSVEIRQRLGDIGRFFLDPQLSGDVLDRYRVAYVLATQNVDFFRSRAEDSELILYTDLGTKLLKKCLKSHLLEPVFRNRGFLIYRVHPLPEEKREAFVFDDAGGRRFIRFEEYKAAQSH